jgi:flagellar hook protein FlgE
MMTQAFYSGISGLKSNSFGIDSVTDNLANINTVGFRGYRTEFSNLYEEMITTPTGSKTLNSSTGVGVGVQANTMITKNGSLFLSDRNTDLAINGDGWFGVQGEGKPVYTRDGAFNFDADDDLVTIDGLHVLGSMGNNFKPDFKTLPDGTIDKNYVLTDTLDEVKLGAIGTQEKLRFPKTLTYPPEPSTNAKFFANLGVGEEGFETVTIGAGVIDPTNTKNHLRLEFTKNAVQNPPGSQWNVVATTQSLDGETTYDTKTGTVEFDAAGALVSHTLTTIDNNGATVAIDLGSGYSGIVSINRPVVPGSSLADGTIGGDLQGYAINQNAEVIATFTNGKQSSVGKIAVFHFQNDQGLERLNGSRFSETPNSGKAIFFTNEAGESINGTTVSNFKLENSNYDMTEGLTELIILQRAYDASSKLVTTADQMMQKALSMDA